MKPLSRLKLSSCAAACALLSCFAVPSFGQLSTASVTGVVRDSSGSVLAGAKLTLTNLATTVKHDSVSNSAGNYLFLSIPPGNYSLDVTAPSFQLWKLPSITLAVNQTATIDVALQVGSLRRRSRSRLPANCSSSPPRRSVQWSQPSRWSTFR